MTPMSDERLAWARALRDDEPGLSCWPSGRRALLAVDELLAEVERLREKIDNTEVSEYERQVREADHHGA